LDSSDSGTMEDTHSKTRGHIRGRVLASFASTCVAHAQDVPGSKDPAGMQRYEGSELIGYRVPKFDEYLVTSPCLIFA